MSSILTVSTVSTVSTDSTDSTDATSIKSSVESIESSDEREEGDAEEYQVVETTVDSVREVYLICDEDAREHEDAVELVNWSTFDQWKQPWHVVKLWEGSVYDEMTLWGSIPLQNDKLRKVCLFFNTRAEKRLYLNRFASIPNDFDSIGSVTSMSSPSKSCRKNVPPKDVPTRDTGTEGHLFSSQTTRKFATQ